MAMATGVIELSSVIGASSWPSEGDGQEETAMLDTEELQRRKPSAPESVSHLKITESCINCRLAISCSGGYCLNYFLRYPIFMLSDDISKQTAFHMAGARVTFQEALTLTFCIAFGLAKVPAVHVMSSAIYFNHRLKVLCAFVVLSAVFSTLPLALSAGKPAATLCGVFMGSFPSSMLFGGLISYVEGRRATELLAAVLTFSATFAGSASRGTATAMLGFGVPSCWMPAVIASAVTPMILLLLWVLDRSPPPSAADIAARRPRQAMSGQERATFMNNFRPGLVLLIGAYAMLSAIRFFRDLFSRDIFTAANGGLVPSSFVFATADLPGAFLSSAVLAIFGRIEDSSRALNLMIWIMILYVCVMLVSTALFSANFFGCLSWQVALGAGVYGMYSLAGMPIYDRLVSAASHGGTGATCTFLIFYADMSGYVAAISLTLWKTFAATSSEPGKILEQFVWALGALCIGILVCLLAAMRYFKDRLVKHREFLE